MPRKLKSVPELDYKKFFDDTPVALIRTDIETGDFLMANKFAAKLFGYKSVQQLQEDGCVAEWYLPEDREKLIRTILDKGNVQDYEIQLKTPFRTIWVSARLHINCNGSCIEGSLLDITELVELRNRCLTSMKDVSTKLDKRMRDAKALAS